MSQLRLVTIHCIGLLITSAGVVVAQQPASKISVERAIHAAEKPGGDFGDRPLINMSPFERQADLRWMGLEYGLRYRYEPAHAEAWLTCLRDDKRSVYARLIAAYYLLNDHEEARKFIAAQMKSPDLRARYNAAATVERAVRPFRKNPQQAWGAKLLVEALADGSLDGSGVKSVTMNQGLERDSADILNTPIEEVCSAMGYLKPPEAVPALISVLQRRPQTRDAVFALGELGDPRAVPILMELLKSGAGGAECNEAYALAQLKHKEAVPVIIERLQKRGEKNPEALLTALLALGDRRAVAPIEQFLATDDSDEAKRIARRVLAQLRSDDPVKELIALYDRETDWVELGHLIDALTEYRDARVTAKFADLARTADFADTRQDAVNGLTRLGDRRSLLELASLLDQRWPQNLKERWIGKGKSEHDYPAVLSNLVYLDLKSATKQDFGRDRKQWEAWITKNVAEAKPTVENK